MHFRNRPHESNWKPTALVIDKDADIHRSIHVMLGKEYDVHHAYFPRLAVSLLQKRTFNVVFTSLDMAGSDELPELHRTIESISKAKGVPVIALGQATAAGRTVAGCVEKPLQSDGLMTALRNALAPLAPPAAVE